MNKISSDTHVTSVKKLILFPRKTGQLSRIKEKKKIKFQKLFPQNKKMRSKDTNICSHEQNKV